MFSILSNNGRPATIQTYLLDLESDLQSIPLKSCSPGDQALVIENSKRFMLNHSKQWVQVTFNSTGGNAGGGGGSGGDGTEEVIYNGGLI